MFRYLILGSILFLFAMDAEAQIGDSDSSSGVIIELNNTLIEVMKDSVKLGYEGRHRKLEPIIRRSHDLAYIARITVGRYWRKFSDAQKEQFVKMFSEYSVATYADRFNGYGGEKFVAQGEEPIKGNKMLVKAILNIPEGEDIQFEYIMSQNENQWRIINIVVDGVSDIALKRSQFTTTLSDEGYEALIGWLSEKISGYEKKRE